MKLFDSVAGNRVRYSKFDLSHDKKMSLKMGYLYPILMNEIIPGDKFRVNTEVMMRLAPMLAPVMTRLNCFIHYFFVPNRLIWNEWENFITGGPQGDKIPVHPRLNFAQSLIASGLCDVGMLWDYLGLPTFDSGTEPTSAQDVSLLPFRAYQEIWKEYYMDRNLTVEDDYTWTKDSGDYNYDDDQEEVEKLLDLRKRCWEKDYFTSALPWAQRSATQAALPMDVDYKTFSDVRTYTGGNPVDGAVSVGSDTPGKVLKDAAATGLRIENIEDVSTNINDLRRSVRLQEWLERAARGGSRYIEQILSHFGVRSSDSRLQRPEFLGGQKIPIVMSEVLQTYQAEAETEGMGAMYGHGIGVGNAYGFKRRFEEHGILMGIMSVLPRTSYQQGLPRLWQRFDKFDYYWPEFAELGEQEILSKEVYYDETVAASVNNATWGYQSRYADYKYGVSTVHGEMKTSLSYWHQGRIFDARPSLNRDFVEADPTKRIFNVTDPAVDELFCQLFNRVDAIRPMPYLGTPTL